MEIGTQPPRSTILSPEDTLDLTGALGDPTRYGIYRSIVDAAGEPLTVSQIAEEFSLHPNVARMHLQKLVDVGLVVSDTRRSKGGGRPARIYMLSTRVANLQFPPRDYQTLANVALSVVGRLTDDDPTLLEQAGRELGREEGRQALKREGLDPAYHDLDALLDSLGRTAADLGMYPRMERHDDGSVELEVRNCVFREISAVRPDLVCRLHTAMMEGLAQAFMTSSTLEGIPSISMGGQSCRFTVRPAGGESET
jgi:predicted ArsR family transcriptional regulator